MLMFKKIIAVVLAVMSVAAFSGTEGSACHLAGVTVPCEVTSWDFGARALYLQPSYSSGDFNYVAFDTPTAKYKDYRIGSGWGFFLEGSYHYDTGRDANLNWYHLSKSEHRAFSGAFEFIDGTHAGEGLTYVDPKWDALNLEFGQEVDFGDNKHFRFHGGAQFARIKIIKEITGTDSTTFDSTLNFDFSALPTYNGFGARFGTDMAYDINYGLHLYANTAMALLAGTSKTNTAYQDNHGVVFLRSASKATLVPELEAKLGIKYDYVMAMGDLFIDLGWMWINYFNGTQAIQNNLSTLTASEVVAGDFGLQGLYFGLHWLGNGL